MKAEYFFIPSEISDISEEEYRKAETVILTLEALSRITYQSQYVIDYFKKKFPYVSENSLFLYGHIVQERKELDYSFYLENIPESEQAMLSEIYRAGFDFYEQLPAVEKLQYILSYDFQLINGKRTTFVNHKFTPILLTGEGKVWLASCAVTPSTHTDSGHVIMYKTGEPVYWKYSFDSHCWEEQPKITLTEREKEVMLLTAQGYTAKEIAKELNIEQETVKYHKKIIFEKLKTENMMEALLFARNYKLL